MKIIHCLNQYMPLAMAGTEIYTHTLATMQKSGGYEVAVVTPHIEYYRPGEINEHYLYEGIDVYQFAEAGNPKDRQVHYGTKKPSGLENFRNLIKTLCPDVIHFHELNRSIGLTVEHVKIAKEYGAKVILTVHLSSYTCNTNILVRNGKLCDGKIRDWTCTTCSYKTLFNVPAPFAAPLASLSIIAANTGITKNLKPGKVTTLMMVPSAIRRIRKELKELTEQVDQFAIYGAWYKKILMENGVPNAKITLVPAALVTAKKNENYKVHKKSTLPLKLVCIGRIQPTKGIHLIIEAMRAFTVEQVQIDFYGRSEETGYYKKCVTDSFGVNNITWKNSLQRNEVVEKLSHYDMLCLASTFSEMSPLVIQEAFAAGIPVLASKVYGNREQVKHLSNGLLFDFNSVASLREQITLLVNHPALIQEMKSNIVPPPGFDVVHDSYLQIYNCVT